MDFTEQERRGYLGCSEWAAALGLSKYATRLDIYNRKLGIAPEFEGNEHTKRGKLFEDIAAREAETAIAKVRPGAIPGEIVPLRRRREPFVHPQYPFLVGHVDRRVEGTREIVEIKCPSRGAFEAMKRTGLGADYAVQMQGYLGLQKLALGPDAPEVGYFVVFCADKAECVAFEVTFDQDFFDRTVDLLVRFWREHVEAQVPPTVAVEGGIEDAPEIAAGTDIDVSGEAALVDAVALLRSARELAAEAEQQVKLARAEIETLLGDRRGAFTGPGFRVFFRERPGANRLNDKLLGAFLAQHGKTVDEFKQAGKPTTEFRPYFFGGGR